MSIKNEPYFKPTITNKVVDVIVTEGSYVSNISQQFTYNYVSTAIVTSLSPNTLR